MNETITRDERFAALDEFAAATAMPPTENAMVPIGNAAMPAIIGAQPIAGNRREVRRVLTEIKELAAAAGSDWFYRFPVRNKRENRVDYIEGPSIKLAMSVMGIVGNIEVDTRVQDYGSTFMIYARAVDLEKGSAITRAFQQNKSAAKIGGADDGRRNDMALQIGQSKAIRNAICALLETYTDFAFDEARNSLVDKIGKNLDGWRERTVDVKVKGAGIDLKRVEAVIGRSADQWLAPDVARVLAMVKAIEDGMASVDDTFPPIEAKEAAQAEKTNADLDEFATTFNEPQNVAGGNGSSARHPPPEEPADVRGEIAVKIVQLASDTKLSTNERLEALELYRDAMLDGHPAFAEFIRTAVQTAARVAKEEMTAAEAKKYLQGLVK